MKLSTRACYAVAALVDIAAQPTRDPVKLATIAARQGISLSYLEQLFRSLRRGGVVRSVRGPGGGYVLARPPAEVRISQVVAAVGEPVCCAGQGKARPVAPAPLQGLWRGLEDRIHDYFQSVSLADVAAGRYPALKPDVTVPARRAAE